MDRRIVLFLCVVLAAGLIAVDVARAAPAAQADATVLYFDDFSDPTSGWGKSSNASRARYYRDGEYLLEIKQADSSSWYAYPAEDFTDFTLEVDARLVTGPPTARYGVIFRWQDNDNFYYLRINDQGEYQLRKRLDGEWQDVAGMEWTASSHLKTSGGSNHLMVTAAGSSITVAANGKVLTTVEDAAFDAGRAGIIALAPEGVDFVAAAFDNLQISTPVLLPPAPLPDSGVNGGTRPPSPRPNGELLFADDFGGDGETPRALFGEQFMRFATRNGQGELAGTYNGVLPVMYANPPLADFYAEFDFQAPASQIDSAYGLILRSDDMAGGLDAYYALRLDPGDAQASLNAWRDGVWVSKQGFDLPDNLLVLDGSNHVRVEAVGSEFRVFTNGELAFAVIDTTLPDPGQVGLFLVASGNLKPGDEDIVYFDNLRIYAPAPVTPDPAPEATVTEEATPASTPAPTTPEADAATPAVTTPEAEAATPAVVATKPAPATPAAPGVTVVLRDGFDDPASGWEVGDYDGGAVGYGDGYYFITADLEDEVMWGEAGRWFSGIAVEFDVTAVRGPENDLVGYGMKCGIPGDDRDVQGYGVFVSGDGEYALFRIIKKPEGEIGNNYEPLVDWTASAAIKQGYVTNHLRIECTGNALVLYINDELVDVAHVEGEIEGDIALAAVSFTEEAAEVHFENLVVYVAGSTAPPAPTAPDAPLPVTTEIEAVVVADALNVRGGPGAGYARVASVAAGDRLPVLGRDVRCSWLYVRTPAGEGWVSGTYIDLTASCDLVPVKEIAAAPAPVATPAAPQPVAAPLASGVIADFEQFGTWRRGDESWATFTQSGEQVHGGSFSGKLAYDFPANAPEGRNYVVFLHPTPIGGQPATLRIWVYGDGSKSFLNVWVKDATGQVWQFTFGQIQHTGWRELSAPLNPALDWPVQPIGGSATALTYPLALEALVLDYPENRAASGVVYLDDLTAR